MAEPQGLFFTYESDWRHAPVALWAPAVPEPVPHRGYPWLHVQFGSHALVFSSGAQLAHTIEVLARTPLPTSRQLALLRASGSGPNGHWLSRLPAALKAPRQRSRLVKALRRAQAWSAAHAPTPAFQLTSAADCPAR